MPTDPGSLAHIGIEDILKPNVQARLETLTGSNYCGDSGREILFDQSEFLLVKNERYNGEGSYQENYQRIELADGSYVHIVIAERARDMEGMTAEFDLGVYRTTRDMRVISSFGTRGFATNRYSYLGLIFALKEEILKNPKDLQQAVYATCEETQDYEFPVSRAA
jgi:hypothetical protein